RLRSVRFISSRMRTWGSRSLGGSAPTLCDAESALEAAHIKGYAETGSQDVTNGLLLRSDIHTLFDLGLLRINPESLTVDLAPELEATSYRELQGTQLHLPKLRANHPSKEMLRARWEG